MYQKGPVSVLLAPLDWGLGHATRCIPIIKELIDHGVDVLIAANPDQKMILIQEFPGLEFIEIPGYNIRYMPGILLKWGLFFRIPSILKRIKRENKWLEKTLQCRQINAVISDNRYGLFHSNCYSVFITHQLSIQSGWGSYRNASAWKLAVDTYINRKMMEWQYSFISKFSACWVPDQEGNFSIAGKLSDPPVQPSIPLKYIGILSRFLYEKKNDVKNSLLIILSGPEPQRSRFENILFSQLPALKMQAVVVRGIPVARHPLPFVAKWVKIYNHLPSKELNELLNDSEIIIARSGYSTIMDLLKVKKNAILVPTPGQTEQEYLGHYLHTKKWMYSIPQKNFNLQKAIAEFQKSEKMFPEMQETKLKTAVEELLFTISNNRNRGGLQL
jgi:UDP:flavonoid glycosyltransferase YjiC (YdhE family)